MVNSAVKQTNTFVLNSAGNKKHANSACTTTVFANAAGAFAVNAVENRHGTHHVVHSASRGDKSDTAGAGNAIIDMTAFAPREFGAQYPQTYGPVTASSSYATPVVAGAATNLKHNLLAHGAFSDLADEVGYLYALMLLMGDGRLQDNTYAQGGEQFDDLYGAGVMKMRMINAEGLDHPARMRLFRRTVYDGQTNIQLLANPDGQGVNQPVPVEADVFRSTAWWLEEQLGKTNPHPAKMDFQFCANVLLWVCSTKVLDDHKKRHRYQLPGTTEVMMRIMNAVVPGGGSRKVYAVTFYEDTARDDPEGPTCADEIDMSCVDCCAQPQGA